MILKKKGEIIIITMILLTCVVSVNAAWYDFLIGSQDEGLEGELPASSHARLNLAGAPEPPEIVLISDIIESGPDRDLTAYGGATNGETQKTFAFYAYSQAGVDALPSGAGVTDTNALIVLVDEDERIMRKSSDTGEASTCVHDRDEVCPAGSAGHAGETCRVYKCSVGMKYYDDSGSSLNQNWEVRAYVEDTFGGREGYDHTTDSDIDEAARDRKSVV